MCGFVGIWKFDGQAVDVSALARATNTLRFRGPDDEGYYLCSVQNGDWCHCGGADSDPRLNLTPLSQFAGKRYQFGLGFRRLSILDLSPAGHQPMSSGEGRFWIVYNGEVYNYVELRKELEGEGYRFISDTDTEVVLAAYLKWGERCVERFNGMWAFAIWDSKEQTLFLSRDRFGIKPLYYYWREGKELVFASEIKAILAAHGTWMSPSAVRIAAYLALGKQSRESLGETFFEEIVALPPSRCLVIHEGQVRQFSYWRIPPPADTTATSDELVERYKWLLTQSVRRHLRSDVPLGASLSGGLDSTSITLLMCQLLSENNEAYKFGTLCPRTFSAVYSFDGPWNEKTFIDCFLKVIHVEPHFVYPDHQRLLHEFEELIWYQEQPFQSLSMFSQWCVMSEANAHGIKVLLDGQGGDEILAGYNPFRDAVQCSMLAGRWLDVFRIVWSLRRKKFSTVSSIITSAVRGAASDCLKSVLGLPRVPSGAVIAKVAKRAAMTTEMTRLLLEMRGEYMYPSQKCLHDILHNWIDETLVTLLRYQDRNSMRWSVESRVPFLDKPLVEYLFGVNHGLWVGDGWTKWIHRQAFRNTLPPEIVWRNDKVGFEAPDRLLLLPNIKRFASYLRNKDFQRYVSPESTKLLYEVVNRQSSSRKDVRLVWRLINLAAWLDIMPRRTAETRLAVQSSVS